MKIPKLDSKLVISTVFIVFFFIIILYTLSLRTMESFSENSKVKKIIESIDKGDIIILQIHAKWCGFCKKLKPIWKDLKTDMNRKKINGNIIRFMEIEDVEKEEIKELKKTFGLDIEFFPSIIKIHTKKLFEQYNGKNTKSKLINWIKKK